MLFRHARSGKLGGPIQSTGDSAIDDRTLMVYMVDINEPPGISPSSDGIGGHPRLCWRGMTPWQAFPVGSATIAGRGRFGNLPYDGLDGQTESGILNWTSVR
jgi:hypothetical protein